MKTNISFTNFCDAFTDMDRNDNFSYKGKQALFNCFEELEDDCGIEVELDVIALCCEYSEHEDLDEIRANYYELPVDEDEAINWLRDRTQVIQFDNGIILSEF